MNKTIRWQQRFENLLKAFQQLEEGLGRVSEDSLIQEGVIKRFEYTFELSWKTLKDYLESQGITAKSPRESLKHAVQAEILENGEVWIDMLEKRNLLAHTYEKEKATQAYQLVKDKYFENIKELIIYLKKKQ